jgi:hypothetical protein
VNLTGILLLVSPLHLFHNTFKVSGKFTSSIVLFLSTQLAAEISGHFYTRKVHFSLRELVAKERKLLGANKKGARNILLSLSHASMRAASL